MGGEEREIEEQIKKTKKKKKNGMVKEGKRESDSHESF